jgi:cytochrome c
MGPKLEGLMGRRAGDVVDFKNYTAELKNSGIVWTEKTLDEYINDPGKVVPGTSMVAAGRVDRAAERRDIIAHVRRQDRSIDPCL